MLTVVTPWLRLLDTVKGKVYTLGEIENYSQMAERSFSIMLTRASVSLLCLTKVKNITTLNAYELPVNLSHSLAKWIEEGHANEMIQNSERVLL